MKNPFSDTLKEEFVTATLDESDRGCVLVAHAFIEEAIQEVLRAVLLERREAREQVIERIVSGSEAFAKFPSRVAMLRELCQLPEDVANAIGKLNTLRNRFAHRRHTNRLVQEDVVGIFNKLSAEHQAEAGDLLVTSHPFHSRARQSFQALAAFLWIEIEGVFSDLQKALNTESPPPPPPT
jgi:DNA-binding MltR family transcriptional regulator